jgi:hypothetical protein
MSLEGDDAQAYRLVQRERQTMSSRVAFQTSKGRVGSFRGRANHRLDVQEEPF